MVANRFGNLQRVLVRLLSALRMPLGNVGLAGCDEQECFLVRRVELCDLIERLRVQCVGLLHYPSSRGR